ncbi:hypothetical protein Aperf_G00000081883 [Anoplocephala perfoliata]
MNAAKAYRIPDLLCDILQIQLRPPKRQNLAPNRSVRQMRQIDMDAAILADCALVCIPLLTAETATSIRLTAGAYEPPNGPSADGLPTTAPTMATIAAGNIPAGGVCLWMLHN